MTVRKATTADLPTIVDVHLASFSGFFLTFLGPRFLRILYRQMIEREVGVMLVCEEAGRVVGFAGGVTQQAGFYSQLVRHNVWSFGLASVGAVFRRPAILPRLLRALRRPGEARQSAADACLLSIGVDPAVQGKGIGRTLVDAVCKELRQKGCSAVCLTTDRCNNLKANRFYQGLGFSIAREYITPEGREMYEYVKRLDL